MRKTTIAASILSLITGVLIGLIIQTPTFAEKKSHEPYERLDTFAQVLSVVERNYVDPINRAGMIDGAIHGMIQSLDPHSSFMTAAERKEFEYRTSGKFVGIGVEVGIRGDDLRVITAFWGGPAQKAGVESGDTILAIDGKDVSNMTLDDLMQAMRGESDSTIKLSVRHPNKLGIHIISMQRAVVNLGMTRGVLLDNDYGYVALSSFGKDAAKKVQAEIERLNSYTKDGLKGLILDLRKNPGGFLNEGVELANLFIPSGKIVSTRGRDGVEIQTYNASRIAHQYDLPMAVLIDAGSASASEIVAGALQDHHRAIIVGQTSFGKASIQNMFQLNDGSSLKLTIGRYYTPSGKCIQGQGIVPDIEVEDYELQSKNSAVRREKDLQNALAAQPNAEKKVTEAAQTESAEAFIPEDGIEPPEPMPTMDLQLFTAIQQLKAREFFMQAK